MRGPVGPKGETGSKNAPEYDDKSRSSITLGGKSAASPVAVHNLRAGTRRTDAVNLDQLNGATESTVEISTSYADHAAAQALRSANEYTTQALNSLASQFDARINRLDRKVDSSCAVGAAMSQMAMVGAGAKGRGRVTTGIGLCDGGSAAVAIGYAVPLGDRSHLSVGAAFSPQKTAIGAGFGFDM